VKKLMILVAMLAMVLVVAAPAMAAQEKMEEKKGKDKMEEEKGKDKMEKKKEEMPKTGGAPINAALLGLGGATLLVGGGLLVRRVTR